MPRQRRADFPRATHKGQNAGVGRGKAARISPTHAEGEIVTKAIREELKQRDKLGTDERKFTRLINQQWTEAQRGNPQSYRPGLVVQFHQNTPGFTRGERFTVSSAGHYSSVRIQDAHGRQHALPLDQSARFQIYEAQAVSLAPGDKIRITQNGFTSDGKHRLNNGAVYQVKGFTKTGDLKLMNGWIIGKDCGNMSHGYRNQQNADDKLARNRRWLDIIHNRTE